MTKKLIKATPEELIGSSFAADLVVSYESLVKHFGQPNDRTKEGPWKSGDGKIKAEWSFKKSKNSKAVITIYDYKDQRLVEEIDDWHVGKKGNIDVMKFLTEYLPKFTIIITHQNHK